jgi:hypothetical protein
MNKQLLTAVVPTLPTTMLGNEIIAAFAPVAYALPAETVRVPFLPVARLLDDAFGIVGNAREQVKALGVLGFTPEHVEVLEHRVAGLKAIHNLWIQERVQGLSSTMQTAIVEGETLRHEMLGFFRAALSKHPHFAGRLGALEMSDTVDGIVSDLSLLNELFVEAKGVFAASQIDVVRFEKKLMTCVETLEKGIVDYKITQSAIQALDLRNRVYTLAMDSLYGVTDAAWAVFGTDRQNSAHKACWAHYACMGEYGWSL